MMKKLAALALMVMFVLSLSACDLLNELPEEVTDCIENPEDPACQDLIPVEDDRSPEEIAIDLIIENYESSGELTFLSTAIQNMDFDDALGQTTEFTFEVTEDIDETVSVYAMIEDRTLFDDEYTVMMRDVLLTVDGEEAYTYTMYYETVDGGVRVYVSLESLINQLGEDAEEGLNVLGFDQPYAMFEFQDSLENVIELEVMKELLLDVFFAEYGDDVFADMQNELEVALQLDLNAYNIDFELFFNTLIVDENPELFETQLNDVLVDDLLLDLDLIFVAPEVAALMVEFDDMDGLLDGMIGTTIDIYETEAYLMEFGTEAYFDSLTDEQIQDVMDNVITPYLSALFMAEYDLELYDVAEAESLISELITENELELSWYGVDAVALNESLEDLGLEAFLQDLEMFEYDALYYTAMSYDYMVDMYGYSTTYQDALTNSYDLVQSYDSVVTFLITHQTVLEEYGLDVDAMLLELEIDGLITFVNNISEEELELLVNGFVTPKVVALQTAIDNDELAEGVIELIWGDPHVELALSQVPYIDGPALIDAFLALDVDAMQDEDISYSALIAAARNGVEAYDAYVAMLAGTAPQTASLLAPLSGVTMALELFESEIDDIEYALMGLSEFEQYIDMSYYMDYASEGTTLSKSDDMTLEVSMDMPTTMYTELLDDLVADLYMYLDGFNSIDLSMYTEDLECESDVCLFEFPYTELRESLSELGGMQMDMEYDPTTLGDMTMSLDLTAFLNTLVELNYDMVSSDPYFVPSNSNDLLTGVTAFRVDMTVTNDVTIDLPTETDDANKLLEELSKMIIIDEASSIFANVDDYDFFNGTDLTAIVDENRSLDEFGYYVMLSAVIDGELSTVTFDGEHYVLDLYWIDGTAVFNGPVSELELDTLVELMDDYNRDAYLELISLVDEDNYNMTKLFMYFFLD
jgi:hypothetical protein